MYHMRWHELITNSRKKIQSVLLMSFKELVYKNGEADELQLRKGNFYDM